MYSVVKKVLNTPELGTEKQFKFSGNSAPVKVGMRARVGAKFIFARDRVESSSTPTRVFQKIIYHISHFFQIIFSISDYVIIKSSLPDIIL